MTSSIIDLGPKFPLGYTGSCINRAAERRIDADYLDALEHDSACGLYVVCGEMIVLKKTASGLDPIFTVAETLDLKRDGERIFLGLDHEAGRFGIALTDAAIEHLKSDPDFVVTDLRSLAVQGLVDADHLALLAEAKSLLHWHARHRFCANCGHATTIIQCGWRRDCTHCSAQHFPRTDPVAIMLTVLGSRCLLGRQARFGTGMWSCLAGFVEPGESLEDAVRRETMEEAGIVCGRVRYFASQPWPFPSSLMIGCHAEALSENITVDTTELEDARWFERSDVAAMLTGTHPEGLGTPPPVAIAHHIIRDWVERATAFSAKVAQRAVCSQSGSSELHNRQAIFGLVTVLFFYIYRDIQANLK